MQKLMTPTMLTSGEICRLTGLAPQTFDEWVRKGVLRPADGGNGHGDRRRFTVPQAIAILMGARIRRNHGAKLGLVAAIFQQIGSMTIEEMEAEIEAGNTYIFPVESVPLFSHPRLEDVDDFCVETAFDAVMEIVADWN